MKFYKYGAEANQEKHRPCKAKIVGSRPICSTKLYNALGERLVSLPDFQFGGCGFESRLEFQIQCTRGLTGQGTSLLSLKMRVQILPGVPTYIDLSKYMCYD